MLKKTRYDGTLLTDLPPFSKLMPLIMPDKRGSTIFFEQEVDVTGTLAYLKTINRELIKHREIVTLFDVVIAAALRSIVLRPNINRFISNGRYWQRNRLVFNFVAKKELTDRGQEVNVKIAFNPDDTLVDVARKVKLNVRKAVEDDGMDNEKLVNALGKLPVPLLRVLLKGFDWMDRHNFLGASMLESDPMWCTLFLSNVGSFGLDAPFHHLFERGNCHIFLAVGKIREDRIPLDGGTVDIRKKLVLRYSYDDRIADGIYMGKALEYVRDFTEHPEKLAERPTLTSELLAEHKLKNTN